MNRSYNKKAKVTDIAFSEHYTKHILPLSDQLEPIRQRAYFKQPIYICIAALLAAISIVALIYSIQFWEIPSGPGRGRSRAIGMMITSICAIMWWIFYKTRKSKYNHTVKQKLIPRLVELFGDLTYNVKGTIDYKIIKKHRVFPRRLVFSSKDYIQGTYKGKHIEICHVTIAVGTKYEYFSGLLILIKKASTSASSVIIKPCDSYFKFWEAQKMKIAGLPTFKMNEGMFDFKFKVYTNDEKAAQVLLSEDFQKKLLQLNSMFDSSGAARCSYMDNDLLIAIPTLKNLFEPAPLDTPSINEKDVRRMLEEIKKILSIVDTLSK